ncbi:hypothetical protein VTJ04DRAFT_5700 [Mycothermus thermophilus]|uniref:uncharacterized protein n=1 Tax=Humicola insolens TaxID=85995 RepID=UPI0037434388
MLARRWRIPAPGASKNLAGSDNQAKHLIQRVRMSTGADALDTQYHTHTTPCLDICTAVRDGQVKPLLKGNPNYAENHRTIWQAIHPHSSL